MKKLMTLLALGVFSVAVLSGCNTVAGAGKDVQKAGEKVEDAAKNRRFGAATKEKRASARFLLRVLYRHSLR